MQIHIGWQNTDLDAEGIRVYRASSPIIPSTLPAVYDTLSGDAVDYIDTDVLAGATYYYVFEVFKDTGSFFSTNVQATAMPYSGPGPQSFIGGDVGAGFYGIVSGVEFITWDAFVAWAGITLTNKNTSLNQNWLKFSHKGKTLFAPKQPLGMVSWQNLYNAGLAYGVDGLGPREYNTLAGVNQQRIITIKGAQFKVRLPTALPPGFDLTKDFVNSNTALTTHGHYGTSEYGDTTHDLTGSEWNDLMYRVVSWTPPSQHGKNWALLDYELAHNSSISYTGMSGDNLFQELVPGVRHLMRGASYRGYSSVNATYHPGKTAISANITTAQYWRPMLEMI